MSKRRGSVIYYFAFQGGQNKNSADNVVANETFTIILPAGESALCVAAGTGWCAVATSAGYLRTYSSSGVQLAVNWLKGPVVAICGDCGTAVSRTRLAVVYHAAADVALKEGSGVLSPQLHLDLIEMGGGSALQLRRRVILSSFPIPLSISDTRSSFPVHNSLYRPNKKEHSILTWLGFDTEDGTLVTMDSKGCFSVLLHTIGGESGWEWMPVLDVNAVKTGVDHLYWPVAVKSSRLVFCLLNGERTPAIYPQPVLTNKSFKVPIAEVREGKDKEREAQNDLVRAVLWDSVKVNHLESEKRDLEQDVTTGNPSDTVDSCVLLDKLQEQFEQRQLEADKSVLSLMQQACKMNRSAAAIDLSLRLLRTEKVMLAAITIANHFGRTDVAIAVQNQLTRKQENDAQAAVDVDGVSDNAGLCEDEPSASRFGGLFNADSQQPSGYESDDLVAEEPTKKKTPKNPFAIASPVREDSSPTGVPAGAQSGGKLKRKGNVFDNMKNLVGSPSPHKQPTLSVSLCIDFPILLCIVSDYPGQCVIIVSSCQFYEL